MSAIDTEYAAYVAHVLDKIENEQWAVYANSMWDKHGVLVFRMPRFSCRVVRQHSEEPF